MSGQEAGLNNELKQQIAAMQKEVLPTIPKDVVEVLMSDENGIHLGELFPQGLLPKVGAEIDEDRLLRRV